MKKKIGLIVDNPYRDLESMALIAYHLWSRGCNVLLIPMYKQRYVVRKEKLDVIVINYLRPNNKETFIWYKTLGLKVIVLDTEGIGGRNAREFAELSTKTKLNHLVDSYLFWGPEQLKACKQISNKQPIEMAVTGCPRFDFLTSPWKACIQKNNLNREYILVNTNFPTVNPLYSSGLKSEREILLRTGFNKDSVDEIIRQNFSAYSGVKKTVGLMAEKFPNETIIIRPHPFESIDGYKELTTNKNIRIIKDGSANSWISNAKLLIHLNCSTAIEASIMGIPVYQLNWLNGDQIDRELPRSLSESISSEQELFEKLNQSKPNSSKKPSVSEDGRINQLFFQIDGKACERVCEQILNTSKSAVHIGMVPKNEALNKIVFRRYLDVASEFPLFWKLKEYYSRYNKSKYFSAEDVEDIIRRLFSVGNFRSAPTVVNKLRIGNKQSIFNDVIAVSLND